MYKDDWWEDVEDDDVVRKIDRLIEDEEISPEEAAFMIGYIGM